MRTPKHTPGPWFYNYDDHCIVNQAGVSVVNVRGAMGGNDTNADTALIAAAPALYAALREAERHLTDLANYGSEGIPEPLLVSVRSAIAQAEGRHHE